MKWKTTRDAATLAYSLLVDIACEADLNHPGAHPLQVQGFLAWATHDACCKELSLEASREKLQDLFETLLSVRGKLLDMTEGSDPKDEAHFESIFQIIDAAIMTPAEEGDE